MSSVHTASIEVVNDSGNNQTSSNGQDLQEGYPKFDQMSVGRISIILLGLGLASFLFAIEQTIVATSVSGIGQALHVTGSLTWITTSYLLTTTVCMPLVGRLADAIGPRNLLIIDIWIFILGNMIAGLSKNLTQLVAGRLIAGIGGSGILTLAVIIISHMTHEKQRGSYFNLINVVYSFADALGPIVGGAFTQSGNWRWIFLFNAPFAPIITFILLRVLHIPKIPQSHTGVSSGYKTILSTFRQLDLPGAGTLIASLTFLTVALNMGGQSYPWNSPIIAVLLVAAGITFMVFVLIEWRWARLPIAPLVLFSKWEWRNVPIVTVTRTLLFFHLFALTFYLPMFLQVIGVSSINASALIIPFLAIAAITSTITNFCTTRWGNITLWYIGSLAFLPVAMGLLSTLTEHSGLGKIVGYSLLAGGFYGCGTQISLVIAQVGLPTDLLSTVTALVSMTPNLGGILGVAVIGTVTQNAFRSHLPSALLSLPNVNVNDAVSLAHNVNKINVLDDPAMRHAVVQAYIKAWRTGCWTLAGVAGFQFLLTLGLRRVKLSGSTIAGTGTDVSMQVKTDLSRKGDKDQHS